MLEIDGSFGEGGGQLVRVAVALSAMTGTAISIRNARARRNNPGLAAQHLTAVRAVAGLCSAKVESAALRATSFSFIPGRLRGGDFACDVGTAGSITLVLQAVLPVLVAADVRSTVRITGGTDNVHAPPADYFEHILLRHLARMGLHVRFRVERRGYYPRGGGEAALEFDPGPLNPLVLPEPGALRRICGRSHVSNLPMHIAERMRDSAVARLDQFDMQTEIDITPLDASQAVAQGGALVAWAETDHTVVGAAGVAQRGVRAETIGDAVGAEVAGDIAHGATLDIHAADQVLIYMGLAGGESLFTTRAVSSHARTAMWLIEQFLPVRFSVEQAGDLYRVCAKR